MKPRLSSRNSSPRPMTMTPSTICDGEGSGGLFFMLGLPIGNKMFVQQRFQHQAHAPGDQQGWPAIVEGQIPQFFVRHIPPGGEKDQPQSAQYLLGGHGGEQLVQAEDEQYQRPIMP